VSAVRLGVLGLVLAAAIAAVLAAASSGRDRSVPALRARPVTVERTLSPSAALFGDRVEAELDVYTDGRRVDPRSIGVRASFGPYRVVATRADRSSRGDISLLRTRYTLQCLARACLPPQGGTRVVRFPAAAVAYLRDGRPATAAVTWPDLQVASRVPATTAAPRIVATPPEPEPGFARPPGPTRALLLLVAGLLAAAGGALLVRALWPSGALARWRRRDLSPLERSLARVEDAARSDDEDERRRRLDELANRLADVPAPPLEARTRALAWGAVPPASEALAELARSVRTALSGSVAR
jgi:hypothetical protein